MIWLDNARTVSIFAVVLLHVAAIVLSENSLGTEYWWIGNIFSTMVRWCVPVLVMISGALLLDSKKQENLSKFYSKRLSRILIPVSFWSIFFLCWTFLQGFVDGKPPSIMTLISNLSRGLPYEHLWFLYMILGLYLFVPFFRKIFRNSSKREIKVLIISTFIIASINFIDISLNANGRPELFINWFLLYLPFLFIGYLIRQDEYKKSNTILWSIFLLSSLLTLIGYYAVSIHNALLVDAYFHGYLSITVIPMSISMMYLLKSWDTPLVNTNVTKQLSVLSFGIYLIHPVIVEILNKTGYIKAVHPIVAIPSATIAIFAISFVIAWIFNKAPYLRRTI